MIKKSQENEEKKEIEELEGTELKFNFCQYS